MPGDVKTQYEVLIEKHNLAMNNNAMKPCEKLTSAETIKVLLEQEKNKTPRSWCLRDWPCLFTQHRDIMDAKLEQMVPEIAALRTNCQAFMTNKSFLDEMTAKVNHTTTEAQKDIDRHLANAAQAAANAKHDIEKCRERSRLDAMAAPLPKL